MPSPELDLQTPTDETPVECLGQTFASDAARREHYLGLLAEKLKDPEFRATEGFPDASDADVLRLSDPPYYTACPNPFAADFVAHHGTPYDADRDRYRRLPFSSDVSEGKTDALYRAHSYHTKVPHKAIVRYVAHYTDPGDVVLDGFCGSGMTGVAAQLCADPGANLKETIQAERKAAGLPKPRWGARRAVLNDLGPHPAFIAAGFNLPFDRAAFAREGKRLLAELADELGWMYETVHTDGTTGRINYTVWSEVFACPECAGDVVFVDEALDAETGRVRDSFPCPSCGVELDKRKLDRVQETYYDSATGETRQRPKRRPAIINYSVPGSKGKHEKKPDAADLALIDRIDRLALPASVPTDEIPYMHMTHERAKMAQQGVTHVHHFFRSRSAHSLGTLWAKAQAVEDKRLRNQLLWFVEQAIWGMSVLARYVPTHFSQVNQYLNGVYYIPSQAVEATPWYILDNKLKRLVSAFKKSPIESGGAAVTTGTAAAVPVPDHSIDYVFTDPPFGENIYYADLNFLVEAWHGVLTDAEPEAIQDRAKSKDLYDYKHLMQRCFEEYHRVLKPGRWITVVFHNSKNAVWNAIQESLQGAGFVVADVSVLDKKTGSYRQTTSDTTKQDLVINAYKPSEQFELSFGVKAGTEDGAWDFVRARLGQLAMPRLLDGGVTELVAERSRFILFDRMVAFHVARGVAVPLSNAEFFAGLSQRFATRDDMVFLPEQVDAYDKVRTQAQSAQPLTLIIKDEATALQWLRQELDARPRGFEDVQPLFMKETLGWSKLEEPLDLRDLLEQSYLQYDGTGLVPAQIHRYLSSNYHDLRGLDKDDPVLVAKAKGRWYVPDPSKAEDLAKIRERELLKTFAEYRQSDKKRIRVVRAEALRAGFKAAHQAKDYRTILDVAERVPSDVVEEDQVLLRLVDMARMRAGSADGPLFD